MKITSLQGKWKTTLRENWELRIGDSEQTVDLNGEGECKSNAMAESDGFRAILFAPLFDLLLVFGNSNLSSTSPFS